ncbi:MAG: 3-deoxy-7-phosphoheptulonate synthase [Acidobacteriota bacterium]|jgi:3-deoxy-7-phosphoheptulonate synthase|nr:3-deoxy-7-phosphoheptulonate synthase [Acidobacteriota bacterium]NLT32828.1 3-deoxy-7-phosphoheptulonate synthase [Acidobacteriota bacterium]
MIIICEAKATEAQIGELERTIRGAGLDIHRSDGEEYTILGVIGDRNRLDMGTVTLMPGVREVVLVTSPYKLASREFHPDDTVVRVGETCLVGGMEVAVMAGPCAVEGEEQIEACARAAAAGGAQILRGGAYKPRSSPYSYQGLGLEGLKMMRRAADRYGLAVVTEVMTIELIDTVAQYADLLQVGARNMQNYPLLTALGKAGKPVFLKRGMSATIQEWLMSAEYILSEGNPDVILCERGIRTFETATRNTLDLSAIPVIKHLSHLPIIADPSHGVGTRRFVAPMARAAVAAGADGIMVEIHPNPDKAMSDGPQSLTLEEFGLLMNRCRIIATTIGRRLGKTR